MIQAYDVWLTREGNPLERFGGGIFLWLGIKDGLPRTPPALQEIGGGRYSFLWDPEVNGECQGFLDTGPAAYNDRERYVYVSAKSSHESNYPPVWLPRVFVGSLPD